MSEQLNKDSPVGEDNNLLELGKFRESIQNAYETDEDVCIKRFVSYIEHSCFQDPHVALEASDFIVQARKAYEKSSGMEGVLQNYSLASDQGKSLMCLAESLLRIPDALTQDKLIRDKVRHGDWTQGKSTSTLAKLSAWSLSLTQKLVGACQGSFFSRLTTSTVKPFVRTGARQSMKILGQHFVMGETIEKALKWAKKLEKDGFTYSYDMLGEAALTQKDADIYFESYRHSLLALKDHTAQTDLHNRPGISIKLSALHPMYELTHKDRVMVELVPKVKELAYLAKDLNVGLTIDAEEARRFELSLDIIQEIFLDPQLQGWNGFGMALQAYQKRAFDTIDWLQTLSQKAGRPLNVRLVKGAYWDSEIKYAQVEGLRTYPVFTRKVSTDISYLACMEKLLAAPHHFYSQFASHNANMIAAVLAHKPDYGQFEFQKLHGMGDFLYQPILKSHPGLKCRIYAPVGGHKDLLSYLVRRLLENGANSSFVNHVFDATIPVESLVENPVDKLASYSSVSNDQIPAPRDLYHPRRPGSEGYDFGIPQELENLHTNLKQHQVFVGHPIINGIPIFESPEDRHPPQSPDRVIGQSHMCDESAVGQAFECAAETFDSWSITTAEERARILNCAADLLEKNQLKFLSLCQLEGGKTLSDAISELREAIDFCRYYAERAIIDFQNPEILPGPTGEDNRIALHPRGVFVCISPWNFPLAIFLGQITGALAAGNCVLAKPASQTPLIATAAVQILHEAGIPKGVLHLIIGPGKTVGEKLIQDPHVAGVAFTGSTETAQHINRTLAAKSGPIVPLIAETGGINAMIVDSSALPEQVAKDVIRSSFQSAGQRCSALRLLFLQEDVADTMLDKIKGAMDQLTVGNPELFETHVGPVIDANAHKDLMAYVDYMKPLVQSMHQVTGLEENTQNLVPPTLFEIAHADMLGKEIFGPILHVVRFKGTDLPKVMQDISKMGYGLTMGIHSRITETVDYVVTHAKAGNIYVNRNMIGAVVGTQPFGGEGLSGTGPKAGGPRYLHRFAVERTVSIDTTASGGNAALLSLDN